MTFDSSESLLFYLKQGGTVTNLDKSLEDECFVLFIDDDPRYNTGEAADWILLKPYNWRPCYPSATKTIKALLRIRG